MTFLGKAKPTVKEIRTVAGLEEKDVQELARRGHEGISWAMDKFCIWEGYGLYSVYAFVKTN